MVRRQRRGPVQQLNTGEASLPLSESEPSNVRAVIGRAATVLRIARFIDGLIEERLDDLVDEFKRDPDRFLPPYQPPPELLEAPQSRRGRGRPRGSTNGSAEYFWEQYRNAVDGAPIGMSRMQRPFTYLALYTRMGISYRKFKNDFKRWGVPEGYPKPHQ